MLFDENENLLLDEKYDQIISNTDRISGIIAREQSLNLLDEISGLLFLIKTYIGIAAGNQVDTSQIRTDLMDIEDEVADGKLYKTKSDLANIMDGIKDQRIRTLFPLKAVITIGFKIITTQFPKG